MCRETRSVLLVLLTLIISGAAPANNWRSHLSHYQVIAISQGGQKVYAANRNGLFSYDLVNKSFDTKTTVEGLSDSGISTIQWAGSRNGLLIGYSNGNLDLLIDNKILNLPFIKNKSSIPKKSINTIYCEGDFAWLGCDFGVVKVNLKKWEVAETWMIGPLAASIVVLDFTADDSYYWAATGAGLFRAEKSNANLQDYRNWVLQTTLPVPQKQFNSVVVYNQKVIACDLDGRIYSFDGTSWQTAYSTVSEVVKIRSFASSLVFICKESLKMTASNGIVTITAYDALLPANTKIAPVDALISASGELWVGDLSFGLFHKSVNQGFSLKVPSSPANNQVQSLTSNGPNIYVATGVEGSASTIPAELHRYASNQWYSVNQITDNKLAGISDILKITTSPTDPEHYWASTSGNGLLEFQGSKLLKQYKTGNSTLETYNGLCRTGGLAFDVSGNLWATNPAANNQLHLIKPDGTWKSLNYQGINNQFVSAGDLLVSKSDTKWIIVGHSDLFAIKTKNTPDNATDDVFKKSSVLSRFTNNETTLIKGFNMVNCFAEDHDGYLWVGTENGVIVYSNPDAIFGTTGFYGSQPSVDLGDGIFHPALENETVNAIAVDGGNRKWFGTANSGVFLFSEDGSKLISHFNTDNSPLFSNHINSIAINGENGEVFFSTDNGLISWMGNATDGVGAFNNLYVWPNPVRETYQGDITIDGLIEQSTVKITDVAGNLVFKTTSVGGRAIWNGKNKNGLRASTGVYLIFCANRDGSQSKVIKLLFIH
jgi:ligand-binding sensor domain-containing protein